MKMTFYDTIMKKTLIFLKVGLISIFLLQACSDTKNISKEIPILNIEAGLKNQKELFLSDIVDSIVYVKLETSAECLLGNTSILVRNNRIFARMSNPDRILIFDLQGNYLSKLDSLGKGPGEYTGIFQWTASQSGDYLAFSDMATQTIFLYNSDGSFVNKTTGTFMWYSGFQLFNESDLIVCTREILNYTPDFPVVLKYTENLTERDTILSKQWQGVSTLPPGLPGIYIPFFRFMDRFYYKEQANDTLYEIDRNNKFQSRLVFDSGDKKMDRNTAHSPNKEGYYNIFSINETSDYLFFDVSFHKKKTKMAYNKNTGELFSLPEYRSDYARESKVVEPINDFDGFDYPIKKHDSNGDIWTSVHQIIYLKELEEKGYFRKEAIDKYPERAKLAELVKNSNMDDNPIVRILHLK
jgi:hypothetical protein